MQRTKTLASDKLELLGNELFDAGHCVAQALVPNPQFLPKNIK